MTEIQKICMLGSARILRKVLSVWTEWLTWVTDALGVWFAPSWCTKRTPAKTVIIETIIIIIIITTKEIMIIKDNEKGKQRTTISQRTAKADLSPGTSTSGFCFLLQNRKKLKRRLRACTGLGKKGTKKIERWSGLRPPPTRCFVLLVLSRLQFGLSKRKRLLGGLSRPRPRLEYQPEIEPSSDPESVF